MFHARTVQKKRDPNSPAERSRARKAKLAAQRKLAHPTIDRGWQYKLYPDTGQDRALREQTDVERALWNLIHEWWRFSNRSITRVTKADLDELVRQGRKDIPWLAALPAQASQAVAEHYWTAWKSCWTGVSKAPDFHAKMKARKSFAIPRAGT
ncbi:MAG: hypothetical protein ACYCYK_00895 [Candidatus Dormibacteria bacterium]